MIEMYFPYISISMCMSMLPVEDDDIGHVNVE